MEAVAEPMAAVEASVPCLQSAPLRSARVPSAPTLSLARPVTPTPIPITGLIAPNCITAAHAASQSASGRGSGADAASATFGAKNRCPEDGHLVALVIAPGWDFHWYRKGEDGMWTHKPGGTPATNVGNSGHLISDPRTADRGPYTSFCTFMVVKHGHIKIR